MQRKFIETERGKVSYWIEKNNSSDRCIVFTHGVTADHTLFDKQIDFWSKEYTIITWDMPLHGESQEYINFTFLNATEDLKTILDKEDITHAVMAGQSAGGYLVQIFSKIYPQMVDAFIGIDTTPLGGGYYKKSELFIVRHFVNFAKLYPYRYYCKVSARAATYTKEAYESFYNTLIQLGRRGMLKCTAAVYKDFVNYDEVSCRCPVLLVIGENDVIGYVKKYNEIWHKRRGYPLISLPEAGHNSNYDNYEEFNKVVYEFLKELR